ncbi:MarP family serine protease [Nocardioides koreensis]|uniref:MarP family serine protease n=2 Tax=Nocardioides koreensis TaxID=433651 RepID=A0ABP5L1W4_9ACTN
MNMLDWLLVVLVLAYALSGYWQGFITGAFATAGLLLGGLFGVWLAPVALGDATPSLLVSLGALFIVILSASLGQAMLQFAGAKIRDRITWQPIRALDAVGGAALSAAAVLLVAWALGVAISGTRIGGITPMVRSSTVLGEVDGVLPTSAGGVLQAFNNVVGTSFFPRYLEPFAPERIVEVGPGPQRLLKDPDVTAAATSVLKVRGTNDCGRGVEGSGFVYAPDRVMTNAHVVAGVDDPELIVGDSSVPAEVVYYNPDIDVAVLAADTGSAPALDFDQEGAAREGVAVLGYPEDGPYDVQPGRIRAEQRLRSPNIYGDGAVIRQVFSLRGLVRPGNSGGPIVSSAGDVVGVVFAASVTDQETGYALTAEQVSRSAELGRSSDGAVSTGDCAG